MRHFFTQHNATDVGECGRACACWLSTRAFALEMHVHFSPAVLSSRLSENLAVHSNRPQNTNTIQYNTIQNILYTTII